MVTKTSQESGLHLESLRALVGPCFPGRVVVMGIGNRFWGDDGAGPELIAKLQEKVGPKDLTATYPAQPILVDAGESPEDWFIRVLDLKPEVIIVIDAIDLQAIPGSIALLGAEELPEALCFSTHRLPLRSLLELWKRSGSEVIVLAIQPENLGFGQGLSPRVQETIEHLIELLSRQPNGRSEFVN